MIHPIWKRYEVNLGSATSVEYTIGKVTEFDNIVEVYRGKAWRKPDETDVRICINDVVMDYIRPSAKEWNMNSYMYIPYQFVVQTISETGQYTEVARVQFVNDWSYVERTIHDGDLLSAPVNGKADARQLIIATLLNKNECNVNADGNVNVVYTDDVSHMTLNSAFAEDVILSGSGSVILNLKEDYQGAREVVLDGKVSYEVVTSCARYCLYYSNALGGWDSFLIEGNHSKTDELTRSSINRGKENDREVVNYRNGIRERVTLHTGWLSDDESSRMHHLLNSTDIYLHDLEKDVIVPVVMESTDTPYKTFKGEGRNLVRYDIEVIVAQTRERR